MSKILFVEPFYGGSHKQLVDTLTKELSHHNYDLVTLSAKKWHWRARCSALQFSQLIPYENYTTLFCSSVLSLAELLGLRSDLQTVKKIIYFHENQLTYPKQTIKKQRDFQYGYNQITSCMAADIILFNSYYNMNSFLGNINKFLKLMPDHRPDRKLQTEIQRKCQVVYFPIEFAQIPITNTKSNRILHIVWPHRWEFDKGPEEFFQILYKLKQLKIDFNVSVLGEQFQQIPECFEAAKLVLNDHILHWGYLESKQEYYRVLNMAHIVVSTSKHEFYGVAILEAVYCGCFPLLINGLVYPELYDKQCLFNGVPDAVNILKTLNPGIVQQMREEMKIDFTKFDSTILLPLYYELFNK